MTFRLDATPMSLSHSTAFMQHVSVQDALCIKQKAKGKMTFQQLHTWPPPVRNKPFCALQQCIVHSYSQNWQLGRQQIYPAPLQVQALGSTLLHEGHLQQLQTAHSPLIMPIEFSGSGCL